MPTERGKVPIQHGAIAPVTRGLWHSAAEKLDEAALGISEMESARDRIQFEAGWARLVDSLQECQSRFFDEGKRTFRGFAGWAGYITRQVKTDPVLKYLVIARHQSQHGRLSLGWTEDRIQIGGGDFCGVISDVKIWADRSFEADVLRSPGSGTSSAVTFVPGLPFLPAIVNRPPRGNEERYDPPNSHLGEPLNDPSPLTVARLGYTYFRKMIGSGLAKFGTTGMPYP